MNAKRLYFVLLGGIGACVLLLIGGVFAANSFLTGQSKQLVDAKLQSMVLDQQQQQLTKQRADIAKYQGLADITKKIVPQDKDQAQTVREIVSIAQANGVKLGSITFPSSSLGGATGTKAAGAATALSQLKPVKNIGGVYSLDITVQSDSANPTPYAQFLHFLDALEHNRRTALVNGVSLVPDVNPSNLTFTLSLSEYIKP